jgi:hypothetical protein
MSANINGLFSFKQEKSLALFKVRVLFYIYLAASKKVSGVNTFVSPKYTAYSKFNTYFLTIS